MTTTDGQGSDDDMLHDVVHEIRVCMSGHSEQAIREALVRRLAERAPDYTPDERYLSVAAEVISEQDFG
jgi:hypothetical protein